MVRISCKGILINDLLLLALIDVSKIYLCLLCENKYASLFCVPVLFYLLKEKHCRSPPTIQFKKNELNGGRANAVFSGHLYIGVFRK